MAGIRVSLAFPAPWRTALDALLTSTLAVALAEIGDKTQLLSLFLASRFDSRRAILLGIVVATLANHALSAWLGTWLGSIIPPGWLPWLISASFILLAFWLLIPDSDGGTDSTLLRYGAFPASAALFFLAEIGDKTQVATVVLAARFEETLWVIVGTTLGMVVANLPVVLAGRWLMERLPLKLSRWLAFGLFLLMGLLTLLPGALTIP